MLALMPVVAPKSLAHSVQESSKTLIVESGLRPGDLLPAEGEIARQLGVSRNSVREAVRALASLGVLESLTGLGRSSLATLATATDDSVDGP